MEQTISKLRVINTSSSVNNTSSSVHISGPVGVNFVVKMDRFALTENVVLRHTKSQMS